VVLIFLKGKFMKCKLIIGLMVMVLSGCSTTSMVPRYSPTAESSGILEGKKKVSVESVKSLGKDDMYCGMIGPVSLPRGEAVSEYIKNALVTELRNANVYDSSATFKVNVEMMPVKFSIYDGKWYLQGQIYLPDGESYPVAASYPFQIHLTGEFTCQLAAIAFANVVKNLVYETVSNKKFQSLVKSK
jgi:hypothetical protein